MYCSIVLLLSFCRTANAVNTYANCSSLPIPIDDARGQITSPNFPRPYPRNSQCKWNIETRSDVKITIEHLDNADIYDGGKKVCHDSLRISAIVNGSTEDLHDENDLCATTKENFKKTVLVATKGRNTRMIVQISFQSDYDYQGTGFSLFFEILCNSTQTGQSGVISSPNYPQDYPNFANCFTEIKAPPSSRVELDFTQIEVTNQNGCNADYIILSDRPPGTYGAKYYKYCSRTKALINSEIVTVQFVSDGSSINKGFYLRWSAVFSTTTAFLPLSKPASENTSVIFEDVTTMTTVPRARHSITTNCSYTDDGVLCQRWDRETPHKINLLPDEGDRSHNFCRNPDDSEQLWCYTIDPQRPWAYCNIDNCAPAPTATFPTSADSIFTTPAPTATFPTSTDSIFTTSSNAPTSKDWILHIVTATLLLISVSAFLFWWKGRKRKSNADIMDTSVFEEVAFHHVTSEDYCRPRENTYVEIPYFQEETTYTSCAGNLHNCSSWQFEKQKGVWCFSHISPEDGNYQLSRGKLCTPSDRENRNSTVLSVESIKLTKERTQTDVVQEFNASSDVNSYAVADDDISVQVAHNEANMDMSRSNNDESYSVLGNVYHAIDCQSPTEKDSEKSNRIKISKDEEQVSNLYNSPSIIPLSTTNGHSNQQTGPDTCIAFGHDSSYFSPELSRSSSFSSNTEMILISPSLIDSIVLPLKLQSAEIDATSPTFEISRGFLCDSSHCNTTKTLPNDKSNSSPELRYFRKEQGEMTSNRCCMSLPLSTNDDPIKKNQYCTMVKSVKFDNQAELQSGVDDNETEYQLSQLYLSMKGIEEDKRRSRESSVHFTPKGLPKARKSA